MKMKEKLTKNHYKGFDKKMKVFSIVSLSMFTICSAVFLPLIAIFEHNTIDVTQQRTREAEEVKDNEHQLTLEY